MKKIFAFLFVVVLFASVGASQSNAGDCTVVPILCDNGNGTNLITCGSAQEKWEDILVVIDALC